jgi:hypothetical protein
VPDRWSLLRVDEAPDSSLCVMPRRADQSAALAQLLIGGSVPKQRTLSACYVWMTAAHAVLRHIYAYRTVSRT